MKITSFFLFNLLFFGIISLTSCKKEEVKTELGEPISAENPFYNNQEEDTLYCPSIIDYKTEIITSNWQEQKTLFPSPTDIDFFDENFGVMSNMSSVFITYDGGANWNYKPTSMNATFFKVKTFGVDKFYLSRIGIQKTEDGGDNYSNFGTLTDKGGSVFNFHIFDSANVLACQGGSILITHNAGQDWERKEDVGGSNIQFLNDEIGYISGGYSGSGTAGGFFSNGDIYKTIDGGETWKRLNVNPLEITTMYFTDENTGLFTDYNGIVYQTIDGGTTWNIINDALCGYYMSDMIFTDKNTGYLAASYGIIFRTEDGGKMWKVDHYSGKKDSYNNHLDFSALAKTPNNTVYITGSVTMKRVD